MPIISCAGNYCVNPSICPSVPSGTNTTPLPFTAWCWHPMVLPLPSVVCLSAVTRRRSASWRCARNIAARGWAPAWWKISSSWLWARRSNDWWWTPVRRRWSSTAGAAFSRWVKGPSPSVAFRTVRWSSPWPPCRPSSTAPSGARISPPAGPGGFPSARRWGCTSPTTTVRPSTSRPTWRPTSMCTTPCLPAASTASAYWRVGAWSGCSSRRPGWWGT